MSDAPKLPTLPVEVDGDVTIRFASDETVTLDGWVASLDGHRRVLEIIRGSCGDLRIDDRLIIVLSRQSSGGSAAPRGAPELAMASPASSTRGQPASGVS